MPAVSKQQFKWLHTDDAKEKLGEKAASEWIDATGSPKKLPEKKKPGPKPKPVKRLRHTTLSR